MSQPVAARPASTVIVLREAQGKPEGLPPQNGFEVLLVKRNDRVAFMAGAYVFPGGRVDEADRAGAPSRHVRFSDLTPEEDAAYRRAAVREVEEEANVRVDPADLEPLAHWVTPEIEIRRYDTRFFLARMPEGQDARHDESETTALEWLTPSAAIARCLGGSILLPPPTWTTLRQLEPFSSIDALWAWARARAIVRVMPGFHKNGTQAMLTLPGDPLFPAIEGWEIPAETRFVLEDGARWRAVKP